MGVDRQFCNAAVQASPREVYGRDDSAHGLHVVHAIGAQAISEAGFFAVAFGEAFFASPPRYRS